MESSDRADVESETPAATEQTDKNATEERFGPYVVLDRLGVGGMATVHRARQIGLEGLERLVALKRLLPHLAEDESFVRGFVREAKLASLLHHSNIAQIYELGRIDDAYYIAMELISGLDVRHVLKHAARSGSPPPLTVTMSMMLQLCDALDHAHAATDETGEPLGIVHRDISPSNLLITPAGHIKVIDFGIARAQSAQLRTQTGRIKGKFGYMAPEVFTGGEIDHRTDLFAVGVVAYELLTARPLFTTKNEYQTILNIQQKQPEPPSSINPLVPPELDEVIAGAIAKAPEDRWATAGDIGDALNEVCRAQGLRATPRDVTAWFEGSGIADAAGYRRPGTASVSLGTGRSASFRSIRRPTGTLPPFGRSQSRSYSGVGPATGDASGSVSAVDDGAFEDAASSASGVAVPQPPRRATSAADASGASGAVAVSPPPLPSTGGVVGAPLARTPRGTSPSPSLQPGSPARTGQHAAMAPALGANQSGQHPLHVDGSHTGQHVVPAGTTVPFEPDTPQRTWPVRIGIAAVAINILIAVVFFATRPSTPPVEAPTTAAVRIEVVPADARVIFDETAPQAAGEFSLEPGVHSVEIRRDGYRSYVSSLRLTAGGNESMRVVLEEVKDNSAQLRVHVDDGAELRVDGLTASASAPVKLEPGTHSVEVWARGKLVWSRALKAEPGTNYDLSPRIELAREAQRETRKTTRRRPSRGETAADEAVAAYATTAPAAKPEPEPEAAVAVPTDVPSPAAPPLPSSSLAKVDMALPSAPPAAEPAPARAAPAPVSIPESWVKRRSGSLPRLTMRSVDSLRGKRVAAKLCIDKTGRVTSSRILAKFPDDARAKLQSALKQWRYTPYEKNGVALPACFAHTFIIGE